MRLCATLDRVPQRSNGSLTIAMPNGGIVHFGIGAFHRAHQAWYTDAAMSAGDRD